MDPDETAHYLDVHCLHRYLYRSTRLKGLVSFRFKKLPSSQKEHLSPIKEFSKDPVKIHNISTVKVEEENSLPRLYQI